MIPKKTKAEIDELNTKLACKIENLLDELGMNMSTAIITPNEIRGETICHGGDNTTGFSFYFDSKLWTCYTAHCHVDTSNDLIGLIMVARNLSFPAALEWASNFLINYTVSPEDIRNYGKANKKRVEIIAEPKDAWALHIGQYTYTEDKLRNLNSPKPFCYHKNLDLAIVQDRNIGYCVSGTLVGRICVPIYNVLGKIVGISGRIVNDTDSFIKWRHWPSSRKMQGGIGFKRRLNLYNIDRVVQHMNKTGDRTVILVEGPWDVIKLEMAGVKNSLAIFGSMISDTQAALLKHLGVEKVVVALDGDEAGQKGSEKILRFLEKFLFELGIIRLEDGIDWGDMPISQIQKIVGEKNLC